MGPLVLVHRSGSVVLAFVRGCFGMAMSRFLLRASLEKGQRLKEVGVDKVLSGTAI